MILPNEVSSRLQPINRTDARHELQSTVGASGPVNRTSRRHSRNWERLELDETGTSNTTTGGITIDTTSGNQEKSLPRLVRNIIERPNIMMIFIF